MKPLNPGEKRLPKDILMAAYEIGKQRKHFGHTISARNSSATYYSFKNQKAGPFTDTHSFAFQNYSSGPASPGIDELLLGLSGKVEESVEKMDILANEVSQLKSVVRQNHCLIDQLEVYLMNLRNIDYDQPNITSSTSNVGVGNNSL